MYVCCGYSREPTGSLSSPKKKRNRQPWKNPSFLCGRCYHSLTITVPLAPEKIEALPSGYSWLTRMKQHYFFLLVLIEQDHTALVELHRHPHLASPSCGRYLHQTPLLAIAARSRKKLLAGKSVSRRKNQVVAGKQDVAGKKGVKATAEGGVGVFRPPER